MTQLCEGLQRHGEMEALSWAHIQPMRNGVQLALRIARQIRALGQILTQQAIGVRVGPALPGAVRISKAHLNREPLGHALVFRHLLAPIVGQRPAQRGRHVPEFPCESLAGTSRIRARHAGPNDQARRPFHQAAHGRGVSGHRDEVAFPVAVDSAARHFCREGGNRCHVRDVAVSIGSPRPRPAGLASLPQCRQEFAAQQEIQARIDRLRRESLPHIVRKRASEAPGYLFGRTASAQVGPDILPEPRVQECAWSTRLPRPGHRQVLRGAGSIRVAPRVARGFAAHRVGGAPQHARDRLQSIALGQSQAQSFTFCDTHVRIAGLSHGNTIAHPQDWKCCTWN